MLGTSLFNPNNMTVQNSGYGTVVTCFSLPGCIVGGLLVDRIGRKQRVYGGEGAPEERWIGWKKHGTFSGENMYRGRAENKLV